MQVPRSLSEKVRNYYSYVVAREVQADEADIIAGLSASLRTQVTQHEGTPGHHASSVGFLGPCQSARIMHYPGLLLVIASVSWMPIR